MSARTHLPITCLQEYRMQQIRISVWYVSFYDIH